MKRLSDYKGENALELWANLFEPIMLIVNDEKVVKSFKSGKNKAETVSLILKDHKKEAKEILLRIDETPLTGLNIATRLLAILVDIGEDKDIQSFFASAVVATTAKESSGSATENTEENEE